MQTSSFIDNKIEIEKVEQLKNSSSTAKTYKLRMNGRLYFMKQLLPEYANNALYRSLFFKEFENGKAIKHPYVVEYTSINESEDGLYIIMEYVNGTSLEEKLKHEPEYFNEKNICKLLIQLSEALKALHNQNIIYLDLSPSNILLTKASNDVKLIDLGFCISDTNDHTGGYTKGFSAPEIEDKNLSKLDARTDIYSVGCILQYIEEKTGKKLPHKLQKIKKRCLQAQKERRYSTTDDIITTIKYHKLRCAGKALAAVAVIAALCVGFTSSPLWQQLDDYIGWSTNRFPERFEQNGVFYRITNHDTRQVEVTYKGQTPDEFEYEYSGGEIIIPQTVTYHGRTFAVTSFAEYTFKNPYINKVSIPEGIETINDHAFSHCNLNGVINIPASVKHIGKACFEPHFYIEGFTVSAGNTTYDSREQCNAIIETATNTLVAGCKNSFIPGSVTAIAANAFVGIFKGENIVLPPSIKSIGECAFFHSGIKEIDIPEGVTKIEQYTFQWSENLHRVTLPQSLTEIEFGAFSHCSFDEISIPDAVSRIGEYAFDCCESLTTVTIGCGTREIGEAAFYGCKRLKKVVSRIPADSLFILHSSVFSDIDKGCVLYVPRGAKKAYQSTPGWRKFTRIVEL